MFTKPDAILSANIGGVNNVALSDKPNINIVETTELSTFEFGGRCRAKVTQHQNDISTVLATYSKRLKRSGYDEVISAQELNIRYYLITIPFFFLLFLYPFHISLMQT